MSKVTSYYAQRPALTHLVRTGALADLGDQDPLGIPRRSNGDAVGLLVLTTATSIAGALLLYQLTRHD
jgi:hypothetical protein